jgi:RNA polymerase sigma-70 factor (ECF subfamily)
MRERATARWSDPAGDAYGSWDEAYRDTVTGVYRLLYTRVGNRADAEDLTSEVFLRALRPLRLDVPRPQVRAYLAATARTVLARHWRRRLGVELTTIDEAATLRTIDAVADTSAEHAGAVAAALDRLPDRYRTILELRFVEGASVKEAAATMGVTVSNAKVLQHRALRAAARGHDVTPPPGL